MCEFERQEEGRQEEAPQSAGEVVHPVQTSDRQSVPIDANEKSSGAARPVRRQDISMPWREGGEIDGGFQVYILPLWRELVRRSDGSYTEMRGWIERQEYERRFANLNQWWGWYHAHLANERERNESLAPIAQIFSRQFTNLEKEA
jgi:hypothetical protein